MRRLGDKKLGHSAEGHQDCGICHPNVKNGKAKARVEARNIINNALAEHKGMNPLRWTIYRTGDDRDRGMVTPAPSLEDLRKLEKQGYRWVDRGLNLESIKDVIADLDMCADLDAMAADRRHEADVLVEEDYEPDYVLRDLDS